MLWSQLHQHLLTHQLASTHELTRLAGVALVLSLANWLAVEPYTTKIMLDRYELENAPQRDNDAIKKLYKSFSAWCVCHSDVHLDVHSCLLQCKALFKTCA